jgi:lipopolysaccharide transport system permease protein
VFFRDLERLVALGLFLVFYVTPVVYPRKMVPEKYHWVLQMNPFAALIEGWRSLFLEGRLSGSLLAASFVGAALAMLLGHLAYNRLQWKFAEAL